MELITEEIIKKIGFKQMPVYKDQYQKGECFLIKKEDCFWFLYNGTKRSEIKYIHELQKEYMSFMKVGLF